MKKLICILFVALSVNVEAQFSQEEQHKIDSLNTIINTPNKHDTLIARAYVSLSEILYLDNMDTLISLCKKADIIVTNRLKNKIEKKEEIALLKIKSDAINNIGYAYGELGDIEKQKKFYFTSLRISEQIKDTAGISTMLNNIATVYEKIGNTPKAIEYHFKALKLREKIRDKEGQGISLQNIGMLYQTMGEMEQAIFYLKKALKINEEIKNEYWQAISLFSISIFYRERNEIQKAKENLSKSLSIRSRIGDKYGEAYCYNEMAKWAKIEKDKILEKQYLKTSLKLFNEINNPHGVAIVLDNLAYLYLEEDSLKLCNKYITKAYEISRQIGAPDIINSTSNVLSELHERQGDYKGALEMYKLHVQMRDSINNEETQKAAIRQQTQYEFEKEQIRKENKAKEKARIETEELKRRNNLEYSLIFLGILLLFGLVLMLGFIKVSPNIAEGLIFFSFLIFFEFVLVFVEPYLNEYTNGEPVYTLLANAGIALLIFPLHDKLEDILKKRIVKK